MLRVLLIMGVSGSGKTLTGQEIARRTGWDFRDADDYHPAANIGKMTAGIPLNDVDRDPWLERLSGLVRSYCRPVSTAPPLVLACSALKASYRNRILAGCPYSITVFLETSPAILAQRLHQRGEHFMPAGLLKSQLDTLETPREAVTVDANQPLQLVLDEILQQLQQTTNEPLFR